VALVACGPPHRGAAPACARGCGGGAVAGGDDLRAGALPRPPRQRRPIRSRPPVPRQPLPVAHARRPGTFRAALSHSLTSGGTSGPMPNIRQTSAGQIPGKPRAVNIRALVPSPSVPFPPNTPHHTTSPAGNSPTETFRLRSPLIMSPTSQRPIRSHRVLIGPPAGAVGRVECDGDRALRVLRRRPVAPPSPPPDHGTPPPPPRRAAVPSCKFPLRQIPPFKPHRPPVSLRHTPPPPPGARVRPTWLRYTLFLVLYPAGVAGEMGCLHRAIPSGPPPLLPPSRRPRESLGRCWTVLFVLSAQGFPGRVLAPSFNWTTRESRGTVARPRGWSGRRGRTRRSWCGTPSTRSSAGPSATTPSSSPPRGPSTAPHGPSPLACPGKGKGDIV